MKNVNEILIGVGDHDFIARNGPFYIDLENTLAYTIAVMGDLNNNGTSDIVFTAEYPTFSQEELVELAGDDAPALITAITCNSTVLHSETATLGTTEAGQVSITASGYGYKRVRVTVTSNTATTGGFIVVATTTPLS